MIQQFCQVITPDKWCKMQLHNSLQNKKAHEKLVAQDMKHCYQISWYCNVHALLYEYPQMQVFSNTNTCDSGCQIWNQ